MNEPRGWSRATAARSALRGRRSCGHNTPDCNTRHHIWLFSWPRTGKRAGKHLPETRPSRTPHRGMEKCMNTLPPPVNDSPEPDHTINRRSVLPDGDDGAGIVPFVPRPAVELVAA